MSEVVRYILRPGFGVVTDDALWAGFLEFATEVGADGAALFNLGRREAAQPPRESITARLPLFAQRIADLADRGIDAQINYFITLGHWSQATSELGHRFTAFTDGSGAEVEGCPCPLDPGLVDYLGWCFEQFAALGADTIWIDDDFRPGGRGTEIDLGCFCTRHLDAFARAHGTSLSRAELVEVLSRAPLDCSAADLGMRRTWHDVGQHGLVTLAAALREASRAADSSIRLGLMTNDATSVLRFGRDLDAEITALATAEQPAPIVRFGGAAYTDERPLDLLAATHGLDVVAGLVSTSHHPTSEVEHFNFSPGQKSGRGLRLELCTLTATIGGDHTLSVNDPRFGLDDVAGSYRAMLRPLKPYLAALRDACSGLNRGGVSQPLSTDASVWARTDLRRPRSLRRNLALAEIGVPLASARPAVLLVDVDDVIAHDDRSVQAWAEHGAVFTARAYHHARRVRGLLTGCPVETEQVDPVPASHFASERIEHPTAPEALRDRDAISFGWRPVDVEHRITALPGSTVWTTYRDGLDSPLGAGAVTVIDDRFRVAVVLHLGGNLKDVARQWLYQQLLRAIVRDQRELGATVELVPNIYPIWWHGPESCVLTLSNFGLEDYPRLTVRLPGDPAIGSVEILRPDGDWQPVDVPLTNGRLVLDADLTPTHIGFQAYRLRSPRA